MKELNNVVMAKSEFQHSGKSKLKILYIKEY